MKFFIFSFSLLLASCSPGSVPGAGGLKIILQDAHTTAAALGPIGTIERSFGILSAPGTTSDFNCFTANVSGDGISPSNAGLDYYCNPTGTLHNNPVGLMLQPASRGTAINADISTGTRNIDVYGLYPSTVSCGGTMSSGGGYYLGGTTVNIQQAMSITIPINYSGAAADFACTPITTGSTLSADWGTGADGSATVITAVPDANTDTSVIPGRTLAAARRITTIDASGTILTAASAFAAPDFAVGDEVLWIVMGSSGSGCTSAPNELYVGKWGTAHLSAVNVGGSQVTMSTPITATPASINDTNLAVTPTYGSTFCYIQIVRVPNFANLTFNSTATIGVPVFSYSTTGGGVFAMRVQGLLTMPNGSGINTTGGYTAGTAANPGDGTGGQQNGDTSGASHQDAGGYSSAVPGGGGGAGAGGVGTAGGDGAGNPTGGSGGTVTTCNSGASTDCLFMGGAGAGATGAGANGGGIVIVYAKTMAVSSIAVINVSGGSAGGANGGGGGGGSILLETQTGSSNLDLTVGGGVGSASGGGGCGGAGGGGAIQMNYCSGAAPLTATTGGGGVVCAGGTNGATGTVTGGLNSAAAYCSP